MGIRYLRTDLERIRDIYTEARVKYTELQDKLKELDNQRTAKLNDMNLSAKGKDTARVKYGDEIRATRAELEELIRRTSQSFSEVRRDVDNFFGDLYRVSPDKLDTNALELLKSGILSDTELIDMAEKYASNTTMRRLIGKYAQERVDKDRFNENMRRLAQSLNHHELLHLEAADTLIYWSEHGLRMERAVSDGIAKRYDEQYDKIAAQYGDISVDL